MNKPSLAGLGLAWAWHNSSLSLFCNIFITWSWLVHYLFMSCSWLLNDFFIVYSWLAYDLVVLIRSLHEPDLLITYWWLVQKLFITYSRLVNYLFMTCSCFISFDFFISCPSLLHVHPFCMTFHYLFIIFISKVLACSVTTLPTLKQRQLGNGILF